MSPPAPRTSVSQPLFLTFNGRRLFALQILPTGPCTRAVLYLPPFAEEMNRCRAHVAALARTLASTGTRTLLLDHFGSGESDGLSTEADWALWRADARSAAQWLAQDAGRPVTVWGMRTGALLAADVVAEIAADVASQGATEPAAKLPTQAALAESLPRPTGAPWPIDRLLFWQPVLDGNQFLNQYLRLRIASQLVHGAERETTAAIQQRLAAGEVIEVAGYPLAGLLFNGLGQRRMADFKALASLPIDWIEVAAQADADVSPASARLIDALRAAGGQVTAATAAGPMFWQLAGNQHTDALQHTTATVLGAAA